MKTNTKKKPLVGEFNAADLLKAMDDTVATLQRGQAHTLRSTTIPLPAPLSPRSALQVRAVRETLGVSQAVFARLLNVSPSAVICWENDQRCPGGPALKLLDLADKYPQLFTGQERSTSSVITHEVNTNRSKLRNAATIRDPDNRDLKVGGLATMALECRVCGRVKGVRKTPYERKVPSAGRTDSKGTKRWSPLLSEQTPSK